MVDSRSNTEPFRLGRFLVQPELRTLTDGETSIHLEPKVMQVLLVLADRAGYVVTRREFFEQVWPNAEIGDDVLSRCIYQLRSYFGDDSRTQRVILTIRKRGYKLLEIPTPVASDPARTPAGSSAKPRPRWPVLAGAAGLAIAAGVLFMTLPQDPPETVPISSRPSVVPASKPPGIVVVPYSDLSTNGDKQYFSEGITEELLNGLGQIRGLRVIGGESAAQMLDRAIAPAEIGETLNVEAMLTGSIRFDGDSLRVSNRLINTATGEQVWAESFAGEVQDIFDIEDKITRAVVTELQIRLIGEVSELQVRRVTNDGHAYQLYSEGNHYLNERNSGALMQSMDFFGQAITEDPQFALAYSSLADANMLLSQYGNLALEDATLAAGNAIDMALKIDPGIVEPHASRGLMLLHNSRYDEASKALRTAAAIDPGYVSAHLWLGRTLDVQMQYSQALAAYRRAHELDPLSPIINMNVGRMLTLGGRMNEADEYYEVGLEYGEDFANLYWARAHNEYLRGRLEEAALQYQNAIDRGLTYETQVFAHLALISIELQDFESAERYLAAAEDINADAYWSIVARYQLMMARGQYAELSDSLLAMYQRLPDRKEILFRAASLAVWRGNLEKALELFEQGLADASESELLFLWDYAWGSLAALDLAFVYRETGQASKQAALMETIGAYMQEQKQRGIATPATHYVRAVWHELRSETDRALREFELAKTEGWSGARLALADPKIASLRVKPEFRTLIGD